MCSEPQIPTSRGNHENLCLHIPREIGVDIVVFEIDCIRGEAQHNLISRRQVGRRNMLHNSLEENIVETDSTVAYDLVAWRPVSLDVYVSIHGPQRRKYDKLCMPRCAFNGKHRAGRLDRNAIRD